MSMCCHCLFFSGLDELIAQNMSKVRVMEDAGTGQTITSTWNCNVCGRKYKDKTKMKHHVETHQDVIVQVCPYCGQKMKTRKSLKKLRITGHVSFVFHKTLSLWDLCPSKELIGHGYRRSYIVLAWLVGFVPGIITWSRNVKDIPAWKHFYWSL